MGKLKQMTELCIDGQYIAQREDLQKQPTEVTHIIVSGRLIYRKGIALLLDAAAKIRTDYPFVVDIYGEGDQMNKLVRQAEELGIAQFVRFHGKISFEQMQQRYREADIYVLPSLRETTGTAVFEAMANKLPVVSLKQNGVKHIVETEMGILVELTSREQILEDMASALKTLIENPQLRREMGQAGFRKIQADYTWSGRAEYMRDVYEAVCRKENSF
jgi:glycosyltransferase involved in cell wall biosynthesis